MKDDDDDEIFENGESRQKTLPPSFMEDVTSVAIGSAAASSQQLGESKISKRRIVDFSSGEEDFVPTHRRLTRKGGYLHTKSSRLKISQANSGNVPWNKGKNRSSDAKAKISAGVKARNQAILVKKLEKLGMTEDEWNESKRKIKLLREKVRKARHNAVKELEGRDHRRKQRQEQEEQYRALRKRYRVLHDSDDEANRKNQLDNDGLDSLSEPEVPSDYELPQKNHNFKVNENDDKLEINKHTGNDAALPAQENIPIEPLTCMPAIFVRDVCWTPHPLDSKAISYRELCPHGGPGGLICCEVCAANYSKFLSLSYANLVKQKIAKVGTQLKDLLDIAEIAKSTLSETLCSVSSTPVPHRVTQSDGILTFRKSSDNTDDANTP